MCGVNSSQQKKSFLQNIYSKLSITCVHSGKWVDRNVTFESVIDNRKASVSIHFLKEAHTEETKQSYTSSIRYTFHVWDIIYVLYIYNLF